MSAARRKLLSLAGIALLAALTFLAWSQPWFHLTVRGEPLTVGGDSAAGALPPLALASLALVLALAIAGPFFRVVLGVLEALIGIAVVVTAGFALGNPAAASEAAITKATGISGTKSTSALITQQATSGWPVLAVVVGALVILTGLAVAVTARTWPASGRKYTRTRLVTPEGAEPDPVQEWDALSEGEDPTERTDAAR